MNTQASLVRMWFFQLGLPRWKTPFVFFPLQMPDSPFLGLPGDHPWQVYLSTPPAQLHSLLSTCPAPHTLRLKMLEALLPSPACPALTDAALALPLQSCSSDGAQHSWSTYGIAAPKFSASHKPIQPVPAQHSLHGIRLGFVCEWNPKNFSVGHTSPPGAALVGSQFLSPASQTDPVLPLDCIFSTHAYFTWSVSDWWCSFSNINNKTNQII